MKKTEKILAIICGLAMCIGLISVPVGATRVYGDLFEGWRRVSKDVTSPDSTITQNPETKALTIDTLVNGGNAIEQLFLNRDIGDGNDSSNENIAKFGRLNMTNFEVEYDMQVQEIAAGGGSFEFAFMNEFANADLGNDFSMGSITAATGDSHTIFWNRGSYWRDGWVSVGGPWNNFNGYYNTRLDGDPAAVHHMKITKNGWTITMQLNSEEIKTDTLPDDKLLPPTGYMGFYAWGIKVVLSNVKVTNTTTGDTAAFFTEPESATPPSVGLSLSGSDYVVSINNWSSGHQYQIWTYQKTGSDIFGGEGETNQWVLSHPYTLGSNRTVNGFTENAGAITRNIGSFLSVDNKYTVAVKVIDGSGNFIGQYKDTYTPEGIGEVVISKVTVDGVFADDKAFVKDIANDSPVAFVVTGNGVAGTVYTAKIDQTGADLAAYGAGLNEFSWDISAMKPGDYSVTLTASTATSTDTRKVNIKLYKNDPAVVYGELTGLTVTGAVENENFKININPTVAGEKFRYRISEPWRGPFVGGYSELMNIPAGEISNTLIPKTSYGIYEVRTYVYRNGVSSADDGAVRTVTNARPGDPVTLNVTVDGNPAGAEMINKAKGTAIVFTPAATGIPAPEYSFWRRDANGWVLIRDYANEGLTWTPNRVGLYTIQVRAKNSDGLTCEVLKNIEFDITDIVDMKAAVTNITINQADLNAGATARTPILITANATSASQDLLYKFIISNGYIHYVETAYSADPTYMWVPGKSGNYTINVLVKNQASFGKYDAVETFTVTVN